MKSLPAPPTQAAQDAFLRASQQTPNSTTLRYTVRLITPMLGGGVEAGKPDRRMYFRASEIKGQLRWWWRTLARAGDLAGGVLTDQQLAKREQTLWGGVAGVRPTKSTVRLAIEDIASDTTVAVYDAYRDGCFGMGYALFPAQATRANGNVPAQPAKDIVCAGASFRLVIRLANLDDKAEVMRVVEAWATFGGMGSRTRRGIGAVEVKDEMQALVSAVSWRGKCRFKAVRVLPVKTKHGDAFGYASAAEAATKAIQALWRFRQAPSFGRNPAIDGLMRSDGQPDRTPGRSRWPEPDAVRRFAEVWLWDGRGKEHAPGAMPNLYPRAAFGLPISIKFRGDQSANGGRNDERCSEPAVRILNSPVEGADRMASPLILRAVAVADEQGHVSYLGVAAVLVERNDALPSHVTLTGPSGRPDSVPTWDATWRPELGAKACSGISPLENSGPGVVYPHPKNAVEAFMNFFARQTP
jgi:CRISPR-associated protein Cmr1